MRCIETFKAKSISAFGTWINYNMRCIETAVSDFAGYVALVINYNMRCIETDVPVGKLFLLH